MPAQPALFASKLPAVPTRVSNITIGRLTIMLSLICGLGIPSSGLGQEFSNDLFVNTDGNSSTTAPFSDGNGEQSVVTKKLWGTERVCVSPEDEIWLISARSSHLSPCDMSKIRVSQLKGGCWKDSDLSAMVTQHAVDKTRATMVFVHGNGFDSKWCKARGLQFYQTVFNDGACRPPLRLILFSWKSESEIIRPIADFKIKSKRAVILGTTFGKFLDQFTDREMLICAYSLGAQVVVTALEQPQFQTDGPADYRVVMLAPAFDADRGCCGTRLFAKQPLVLGTQVFVNRKDRSIKIAERVARKNCSNSVPMLSGLTPNTSIATNRICINDISREVKGLHLLGNYADSPSIQSKLVGMLSELSSSSIASPALETSKPVAIGDNRRFKRTR